MTVVDEMGIVSTRTVVGSPAPGGVTGASFWLDPYDDSTLTFSGSNITGVRNKITRVPMTVTSDPTLDLVGGKKYLNFDSGDWLLGSEPSVVAMGSNGNPFTAYGVISGIDASRVWFSWGDSGSSTINAFVLSTNTTGGGRWRFAATNTAGVTTTCEDLADYSTGVCVVEWRYDGTTVTLRENGVPRTLGVSTFVPGPLAPNRFGVAVNAILALSNAWTSTIGDIIIFPTAKGLGERNAVTAYLGAKYGISVSV